MVTRHAPSQKARDTFSPVDGSCFSRPIPRFLQLLCFRWFDCFDTCVPGVPIQQALLLRSAASVLQFVGGSLCSLVSERWLTAPFSCIIAGSAFCTRPHSAGTTEHASTDDARRRQLTELRQAQDSSKVDRVLQNFQLHDAREYALAIGAFGRLHNWQRALALLEEMHVSGVMPSVISFNAAIMACKKGGQWDYALSMLERMRMLKISPNIDSFSEAIWACESQQTWKQSILLLEAMQVAGVTPAARNFNAVISACEQGEQWQQVLSQLEKMQDVGLMPNIVSFNKTFEAFANCGQWQSMLVLLKKLQEVDITPDASSYSLTISECDKAGLWRLRFGDQFKADLTHARFLEALTAETTPMSSRNYSTLVSGATAWENGFPRFLFGNFEEYYDFRHTSARIEAVKRWFSLQKAWTSSISSNLSSHAVVDSVTASENDLSPTPFNQLHILDIGCNSGQVTAEIARAAEPNGAVLGIDIDSQLIAKARERHASFNLDFANLNVLHLAKRADALDDFFRRLASPVEHSSSSRHSFQLIFALSVTKWIHYQYGDSGIRSFFEAVYNLLSDDQPSYFVLEPQRWNEYCKRRKLSKDIDAMVATIQLRPESFTKWLTQKDKVRDKVESDDSAASWTRVSEPGGLPDEAQTPPPSLMADIHQVNASASGGFELVHAIHASELSGFDRDLFIYKKRAAH